MPSVTIAVFFETRKSIPGIPYLHDKKSQHLPKRELKIHRCIVMIKLDNKGVSICSLRSYRSHEILELYYLPRNVDAPSFKAPVL